MKIFYGEMFFRTLSTTLKNEVCKDISGPDFVKEIASHEEVNLRCQPTDGAVIYTVSIFNSCTNCKGYNTKPHARLPTSFLGMDVSMTSQLNLVLVRKLHGSLMYLAYFSTCYPWVFVQPGTCRRPLDWRRN